MCYVYSKCFACIDFFTRYKSRKRCSPHFGGMMGRGWGSEISRWAQEWGPCHISVSFRGSGSCGWGGGWGHFSVESSAKRNVQSGLEQSRAPRELSRRCSEAGALVQLAISCVYLLPGRQANLHSTDATCQAQGRRGPAWTHSGEALTHRAVPTSPGRASCLSPSGCLGHSPERV